MIRIVPSYNPLTTTWSAAAKHRTPSPGQVLSPKDQQANGSLEQLPHSHMQMDPDEVPAKSLSGPSPKPCKNQTIIDAAVLHGSPCERLVTHVDRVRV